MEDTIKKIIDDIRESVSKELLYDLMSKTNLPEDSRNFIESLLRNGCPASAIFETIFSLAKGGDTE